MVGCWGHRRATEWVGGGCKNVECKGILKETNDDNTICSFVVLFVLNGGTVSFHLFSVMHAKGLIMVLDKTCVNYCHGRRLSA